MSILELSLVTELITWLLFILALRLNVYLLYLLQMPVFLSITDISEVFASVFKFLLHLLVQTSCFLFYIPATNVKTYVTTKPAICWPVTAYYIITLDLNLLIENTFI